MDEELASLMRAAQAGDAGAYTRLLAEIAPRIRRVVRNQRRFLANDDIEDLARISHTIEAHRGAESAKVVVPQRLPTIRGAPRCRQSVAQTCLNLHPWNAEPLWRGSTAGRSRRTPGRCCWERRIVRSG